MDENDETCASGFDWDRCCGWMLLLRAPAVALRPTMLAIAVLAALMSSAGWRLCGLAFSGSDRISQPAGGSLRDIYDPWPWEWSVPGGSVWEGGRLAGLQPVEQMLTFGRLFHADTGVVETAYLLLCLIWGTAVWAIAGGAMTRIAAMALTRREACGWKESIGFSRSRFASYFGAPIMPLLGIALIAVPMLIASAVLMHFEVGLFAAGVLWPLWILGGVLIGLLLVGLALGWPLMTATISCEGTDAFDALGRSYGYIFGRPLKFFCYVVVAFVIGSLAWWVVDYLANLFVQCAFWAASWGASSENIRLINIRSTELGSIGENGAAIIGFWNGCVLLLPIAFFFGFTWSSATAAYLLLRRDEDAVELDEVYLDDESSYGMPPLETDEQGVPGAADVPPEETPADSDAPADAPEPASGPGNGSADASHDRPDDADEESNEPPTSA